MQPDESWRAAYSTSATSHHASFYDQSAYQSAALEDAYQDGSVSQAQAQTPDVNGLWDHGNKRVRLNDYQSPLDVDPTFQQQRHGLQYGSDVPPQAYPLGYQDMLAMESLNGQEQQQKHGATHLSAFQSLHDSQQAGTSSASGLGMSSQLQASDGRSSRFGAQQAQYYPIDMTYNPPSAAQDSSSYAPYVPGSEWTDSHYPYMTSGWQQQPQQTLQTDTAGLYGKDASLHLKLQSLSILDSLATQIIVTLAKPSLSEIDRLTSGEESEDSQAYATRKNLFDQTRRVYSRDASFIDAVAIQLFTPSQQDIVRKANRATFVSIILEGHDVSFFELNDYFLEVFVAPGQRLLKWQGGIFLELKTQVYISAVLNSDPSAVALLNRLFPPDLEDRIAARHRDAPSLAPSEQDFMERAKARKQYLQAEPIETAAAILPKKYEWQDFVKEFASCISKNVDTLLNPPNRPQPTFPGGAQSHVEASNQRRLMSPIAAKSSNSERGWNTAAGAEENNDTPLKGVTGSSLVDHSGSSPVHTTAKPQKSSTTGAPRQPWKQEEEDALLAGLEAVHGPHWSQILSLYGRGGSISEVLKDRNQIQLKDKARNLKLWYLKMGNEVPACLQGVTGELRKRGGARVRAALGLDGDEGKGRNSPGVGSVRGPKSALIDPALH